MTTQEEINLKDEEIKKLKEENEKLKKVLRYYTKRDNFIVGTITKDKDTNEEIFHEIKDARVSEVYFLTETGEKVFYKFGAQARNVLKIKTGYNVIFDI